MAMKEVDACKWLVLKCWIVLALIITRFRSFFIKNGRPYNFEHYKYFQKLKKLVLGLSSFFKWIIM
jgi:hypothetical protein